MAAGDNSRFGAKAARDDGRANDRECAGRDDGFEWRQQFAVEECDRFQSIAWSISDLLFGPDELVTEHRGSGSALLFLFLGLPVWRRDLRAARGAGVCARSAACCKSGINRSRANDGCLPPPDADDLACSAFPISRVAAAPITWFGVSLYAAELRTYSLGAVVCVALGAGAGWGWHYFADTAGAAVIASAATSSARQYPVIPPPSNPLAARPGPALDVPKSPDLSNVPPPAPHYSHKSCSKGHACRKYLARGQGPIVADRAFDR